MIVKSESQIEAAPVTMPGAANVRMQMLLGPAENCPNFAMRKFTVAPGGHTPHHKHNYEHEVLVLAGRGVAIGPTGETPLQPGDVVYVPADEMHQFQNRSDTEFKFICLVPASVHKPVDCSR